jgi:hypothetical protein
VATAPCDPQDMTLIVVLMSAGAVVVSLAALTAVGERRRGGRLSVAVLTGLFFPLAWIAWYARDGLQTF